MSDKATFDLWWKNAIVYCVDVELFADSNGDGCGDFPGLTDKVDYLAGLGVTCVWLMPFYPTPNKDNGYDISDFYGVDPRLGSLGDLVEFLRAARERGIRVIADLVVNHTSDQHPRFQSARADERDCVNHGCSSEVWLTTRSTMMRMPRSLHVRTSSTKSPSVPSRGSTA